MRSFYSAAITLALFTAILSSQSEGLTPTEEFLDADEVIPEDATPKENMFDTNEDPIFENFLETDKLQNLAKQIKEGTLAEQAKDLEG